ncbi:MAG: hypothetical protein U1D55_05100 [Phycisphaerae bacterium]
MLRKLWVKGATLLVTGGTLFALGGAFDNGCLAAVVQRILVAVNFD